MFHAEHAKHAENRTWGKIQNNKVDGFVGAVLQKSERLLEKKYKPKRPIEELIEVVAGRSGLKPELICSGSRQKKIAEARALVAYLAVEETGHSAADVARYLGIGRTNILRSIKRGREI